MGQWLWDSMEGSGEFIIKGPRLGAEIWKAFGPLFPMDSPTRWWPAFQSESQQLRWGDVKDLVLDPESSLELPGAPVQVGPLVHVVQRLLGDGGCPWDRQQTSQSLLPYLLDESYEAAEALVAQDFESFQGELGDVLLQIIFQSALLQDAGLSIVVGREVEKLIRRHPHVFGDEVIEQALDVQEQWDRIKDQEKHEESRSSWVYPSLVMAKRESKRGVDPKSAVFQAVRDFMQVYIANTSGTLEEILADAAWAIADVGRQHHLDVEWALWRRLVSQSPPSQVSYRENS